MTQKVEIVFHPSVHGFKNGLQKNSSERIEIHESEGVFNKNLAWKSGHEFFLDTSLFRGKGVLYCRGEDQFPKERQYVGKEMVIRIVGQVKVPISIKEVFMGGVFHKGIRGLPRDWILDIGMSLARKKSPHFFMNFSPKCPYIAVPLFTLLDELHIFPFNGQGIDAWVQYNLHKPIIENWVSSMDSKDLQYFRLNSNSSSSQQRDCRHKLRVRRPQRWPKFMIYPHQVFAFELTDSAFVFQDFKIHWKFANIIPISIDLTKYIYDLPFSVFLLHPPPSRIKCKHNQKSPKSKGIPVDWFKEDICGECFPPREEETPKQFLFALAVYIK